MEMKTVASFDTLWLTWVSLSTNFC